MSPAFPAQAVAAPAAPAAVASPLDVFHCPLTGTHLIEASAGTGKTWNLCGLVLRLLIERRLPVQQVLVVTFTNAATAELRERIRERLSQTLAALQAAQPTGDAFVDTLIRTQEEAGRRREDLAVVLDLALQTFDEASIFTIHGFCQRALADAPFAAGLPLRTELLADDSELRLQVVQDHWRRHVADADLPPELAAHLLASKDSPERWAELLQGRMARPLSRLRWPAGMDEGPADDTATALLDALAPALAVWRTEREDIIAALDGLAGLNKRTHSARARARCIDEWDRLAADPRPRALLMALAHLEHLCWDALQFNAKTPRPAQPPHRFFTLASAVLQAHGPFVEGVRMRRLRLIRDLLEQGPAQLRALKQAQRVVAFDDMLANLHARLADEAGGGRALAKALRERFPVALIDEFQDTDPLQFDIFRRIHLDAADPSSTLFFVGDPKQAIYSFRNADLRTYLQAAGRMQHRHTLAQNQRSVAPLVDALNALFGTHAGAFALEGLTYTPVSVGAKPRVPLHDDSGHDRAALQLWQLPTQDDGAPLLRGDAQQQAVSTTAAEIARLLAAGQRGEVRLDDRPLQGGDIAVLVRAHSEGALVREALAALGVASVELSQRSVFATVDAMELEHLLAAALEPGNERLLRRALATSLLGFDAPALEALGADERAWTALVQRFLDHQSLWLRQGVGVMLRRLMSDHGIAERLLRRPDGERRLTNLMHLAELLHETQREGAHATPAALLRWLAEARRDAREGVGSEAAQLRLESDRQLVQIVTIHKSKGLEYPIVFCPLLWKGARRPPAAEIAKREFADAQGRVITFDDAERDAHDDERTLEAVAEDLRLLYVALTRAVHRCVMVVGGYATRSAGRPSDKESRRAPLNWLVAGGGQDAARWFDADAEPLLTLPQIASAWLALAQRAGAAVSLRPLPPPDAAPPLPPLDDDAATLAALPPPARLPRAWWVGSYSALASGVKTELAPQDRDAVDDEDAPAPRSPSSSTSPSPHAEAEGEVADPALDLLNFPRGAEAGTCLHAVFERADFTRPETWPGAVAAALQRHPPDLARAGLTPQQAADMLLRMLRDVLDTPLPLGAAAHGGDGLRLSTVGLRQRRVEMEFNLHSPGLSAAALQALMHAHGLPAPALAFGELQGFLRGFIDLVFEHDGRFYIVDWKSNHLGARPRDYGRAALHRAMTAHGYHLQALLYATALHRYLQQALPGYDPARHFGGVAYLFVRGLRPGWVEPDGTPTGVFVDRPPTALLEGVLALLQGQPDPVTA